MGKNGGRDAQRAPASEAWSDLGRGPRKGAAGPRSEARGPRRRSLMDGEKPAHVRGSGGLVCIPRERRRNLVVELGFALDAVGERAGQFDLRGDGPYR